MASLGRCWWWRWPRPNLVATPYAITWLAFENAYLIYEIMIKLFDGTIIMAIVSVLNSKCHGYVDGKPRSFTFHLSLGKWKSLREWFSYLMIAAIIKSNGVWKFWVWLFFYTADIILSKHERWQKNFTGIIFLSCLLQQLVSWILDFLHRLIPQILDRLLL